MDNVLACHLQADGGMNRKNEVGINSQTAKLAREKVRVGD